MPGSQPLNSFLNTQNALKHIYNYNKHIFYFWGGESDTYKYFLSYLLLVLDIPCLKFYFCRLNNEKLIVSISNYLLGSNRFNIYKNQCLILYLF